MSINIAGFVKRLLPTLSKSDMESDLEVSLSSLKVVLSTYEDIKAVYAVGEFKAPKAKALLASWYKEFNAAKSDIRLAGGKHFAADLVTLIKNVEQNGEYLRKEVADIANEVIVSKALSAYKSNVLRAVEHYFFLSRYALDLANLLYVLEAQHGGVELSKSACPNAKQVKFVEDNIWIFARIMSVYGQEFGKFKAKLDGLSMVVINQDQMEEALGTYSHSKLDLFDNLPAGFIGSPIYSVRLVWVQWEADRYKQLKDKKKLLELRSLHLKLIAEHGGGDVNTERELEYLQKRITDIDYKVAKVEESARD
jgi:hypothetical protein